MHHLVYKTTCLIDGSYYIGKHSTSNILDGYLGSGKRLKAKVNKHGRGAFTRTTLGMFESQQRALRVERRIMTSERLKDPLCLNLVVGGWGGMRGFKRSDENRQKLRRANLGKRHSPETIEKLRSAKLNDIGRFERARKASAVAASLSRGKPRADDVKRKVSLAKMGHIVTEETRRKISETKRRRAMESRLHTALDLATPNQGTL